MFGLCIELYGSKKVIDNAKVIVADRGFLQPWLVIFQSFAFIILASVLCRFSRLFDFNKRMAGTSFFIYSIHLFTIGYVTIIVNKLMPVGDIWYVNMANYFIAVTTIILVCLMAYLIMLKCVPNILGILVGDRKNKE